MKFFNTIKELFRAAKKTNKLLSVEELDKKYVVITNTLSYPQLVLKQSYLVNDVESSAFRKAFPEAGEKFRWHTALRVEKQLFTENETFQTISKETGEKFNSIVKELITELKEKINL